MDPTEVNQGVAAWLSGHPAHSYSVAAGPRADLSWLVILKQGDRRVETALTTVNLAAYAGVIASYVGTVLDVAAAGLAGAPVTVKVIKEETPLRPGECMIPVIHTQDAMVDTPCNLESTWESW